MTTAAGTTSAGATIATLTTLSDYAAWTKGLRQGQAAEACTGCSATGCALYGYGGEETCIDCA